MAADLYPKQQVIYEEGEDREVSLRRKNSEIFSALGFPLYLKKLPAFDANKVEGWRSKLESLKELELDGFSSLAEASTWCARVFWIVFLCIVLTFMAFELYKTADTYVNQPVITTYTITKNDSMQFPGLLVCLDNVFNDSRLRSHPEELIAAKSYSSVMLFADSRGIKRRKRKRRPKRQAETDQDPFSRLNMDDDNSADLLNLFSRYVRQAPSDSGQAVNVEDGGNATSVGMAGSTQMLSAEVFYKSVMSAGFDADNIFLDCRFFENDAEIIIPCREIVQEVLDVNYAKCFLISVGDRRQTAESKALSLTINTLNSQNSKNVEAGFKRFKGLFLSVDDGFNPTSWEKVLVGGGVYMKLDLSLEHLQLMNIESDEDDAQPCISSEKASLRVVNTSYSLSTCQLDCFIAEVVNKCNCLMLMDKRAYKADVVSRYGFCEYTTQAECIEPRVVNDQSSEDAVDECRRQCHIQCDSWRYKASPSTMALNREAFRHLLPIPHTDLVQLDVSYRSLEYKEFIQSYQMTLDTFIGNLGGQITLWIGGSMITLINIPIIISAYMLKKSLQKAKQKLLFRQQTAKSVVVGFQDMVNTKVLSSR